MLWINNNRFVRQTLTNFYDYLTKKYETITDTAIVFQETILNLKETNYIMFKNIVGLMFIDQYLMLKFKEQHNKLDEEEQAFLERYTVIEDIDDLIFNMEIDSSLLYSFIFSTIKFNKLNTIGQGIHLCSNEDNLFIKKFSPMTCLEQAYYLQDETLNSLIEQYYKIVDFNSKTEDNKVAKEQAELIIVDTISLKKDINYSNFVKLTKEIILTFYKWKKIINYNLKNNYLIDYDIEILELIEKNDISMVIQTLEHDKMLFEYITCEYIYYMTELDITLEQRKEVDDYYHQFIEPKIENEGKTKEV